jgi:hypothetical protein
MKMMNKLLIVVYVPAIEKRYEIKVPKELRIEDLIRLIIKGITELNKGIYELDNIQGLFDKSTAKMYEKYLTVSESDMKNGTELFLI